MMLHTCLSCEVRVDDEFRSLLTPLSEDERTGLEANLKRDGCIDPLVVWNSHDGQILLDGHNRHEICTRNGIDFDVVVCLTVETRDDAKIWIIDTQRGRRNLNMYQRTRLELQKKDIIAAKAKEQQGKRTDLSQNSVEGIDTQKLIAKAAGVSHDTVYKVECILREADDEVKEKLERGTITINQAYLNVTLPERRQGKIEAVASRVSNVSDGEPVSVILCDPPWRYEHDLTTSRAVENHYPTLMLQELFDLKSDIHERITTDAILFLWSTCPKAAEAHKLIEAWGFNYRTCAIWDKMKIGMGYYFRQQCELLLVATRGNIPVPIPENRVSSLFREKRSNTHSEKPEWVYRWIERNYEGLEKLEMFARSKRPGWHSWGNELSGGESGVGYSCLSAVT